MNDGLDMNPAADIRQSSNWTGIMRLGEGVRVTKLIRYASQVTLISLTLYQPAACSLQPVATYRV